MKAIGLKNKASVYLVIFLLIAATFIANASMPIKFGTNSESQSFFGINQTSTQYITNSNGRAWTATGANLQAAIDSLGSGGGKILCPVMDFSTSGLYINESNIVIEGCGNESKIRLSGSTNTNVFTCTDVKNVHFKNLFIDGNEDGQTYMATGHLYQNVVYFNRSEDCSVENCYIINATRNAICSRHGMDNSFINNIVRDVGITLKGGTGSCGIYLRGDNGSSVINNKVHNCYANGIVAEHGHIPDPGRWYSNHVTIVGNVISDCVSGIWVEAAENTTITGNVIYNNTKSESYGQTYSAIMIGSNAYHTTVTANSIYNSNASGISVWEGPTAVTANTIVNASLSGIACASNAEFITISANTIRDVGNTALGYGIDTYTCSNISIMGNLIYDVGAYYGISVSAGSENVSVVGNIIDTINDDGILIQSTCKNVVVMANSIINVGAGKEAIDNDCTDNALVIANLGWATTFPTQNNTYAQAGYAWLDTNTLRAKNTTGVWVTTTLS